MEHMNEPFSNFKWLKINRRRETHNKTIRLTMKTGSEGHNETFTETPKGSSFNYFVRNTFPLATTFLSSGSRKSKLK